MARLKRHASDDKKPFWHIDYFLMDPGTRLVSWKVFPGQADRECELVKELLEQKAAAAVIGFGNSDCKNNCPGHLIRLSVE